MAVQGNEWIFVSYRRKDTGGYAKALSDRLKSTFGADAVFLDTEAIAPGAVFPDRLRKAVESAWVVLVVIGPDWLDEITRRAAKAGEDDFVRMEVTRALAPRADGSARLVVPVQMGGAKPITPGALPAALLNDIGGLTALNAIDLEGAGWDAGFQRLVDAIKPVRQARAGGACDHAAMAASIAAQLRTLLARKHLQVLVQLWQPPEHDGVFAKPASAMLLDFSAAVKDLATSWQDDPAAAPASTQRERLAQACREIASLLIRLGVDPEKARQWVQSGQSVPAETVGMAALVRAVAAGEPLVPDPEVMNTDFHPERHYALVDALDSGAAARHRTRVAHGLWRYAFAKPLAGAMTEADCTGLALRIANLTKRDGRSFVVTAAVTDPAYRGELTQVAQPFNAVGLGRQQAPDPNPLLLEPERELIDPFCLCLEAIEQLTP